jgi:peptidoglycan/LPS O-acetylase OafA/YrhL
MRYLITGVALLLGVTLMLASFVAGQQFRKIASSPLLVTLDDYPLLEFVGGGLLRSTNPNVDPAAMAHRVQQRIGLIALGGLIFLLVGVAFFTLTKPKPTGTAPSNLDSRVE